VIQPVETPSSPEIKKQASSTSADRITGKDFAALHAAAVARDKKASSTDVTPASARIEVPEGETWKATKPGSHYALITGGPREGQYINLTHGERRGQTFTVEHRDGKKLHVYGTGGAEVEIKPSVDAHDVSDAAKRAHHRPADQPRAGENWTPVEGHSNYADIVGGSRNGLFVNISGGIRDGMAFQIVKKGDKTFHVYGTGKQRQEILVSTKKESSTVGDSTKASDTSADASDATEVTASGTGGTSAPTTGD
jgi:hypothetical protein